MKDKIRENAKKYFEEELSGETLYQYLVIDWLTEFAEQQVKLFAIPDVVPRISHKVCDCSELKHKIERDQFPYGDDIEYDECPKCGARYNLHYL